MERRAAQFQSHSNVFIKYYIKATRPHIRVYTPGGDHANLCPALCIHLMYAWRITNL